MTEFVGQPVRCSQRSQIRDVQLRQQMLGTKANSAYDDVLSPALETAEKIPARKM
mgnify:CR=1 FL=1